MATKLLPHNIPVFNEFCSTVDAHNKAMIITFTGGGKTFLTSRFLEVYDIHNALLGKCHATLRNKRISAQQHTGNSRAQSKPTLVRS